MSTTLDTYIQELAGKTVSLLCPVCSGSVPITISELLVAQELDISISPPA